MSGETPDSRESPQDGQAVLLDGAAYRGPSRLYFFLLVSELGENTLLWFTAGDCLAPGSFPSWGPLLSASPVGPPLLPPLRRAAPHLFPTPFAMTADLGLQTLHQDSTPKAHVLRDVFPQNPLTECRRPSRHGPPGPGSFSASMFLTLSSIFAQTGVSAGFPSSGVLQPSSSCKRQHLDTLRLQTLQVLADAHSPVRRQNDVECTPPLPPHRALRAAGAVCVASRTPRPLPHATSNLLST